LRVLVIRQEADSNTWREYDLFFDEDWTQFAENIHAALNASGITELRITEDHTGRSELTCLFTGWAGSWWTRRT
jgi:hypothetical protein